MPTETPQACKIRERLENVVQLHLRELASLATEEVEIVSTGDRARILEVDKRIENLIGEKERALGALNEHRSEHGC